MSSLSIGLIVVLSFALIHGDDTPETEGELGKLIVEVVEKPEECEKKSERGKMLKLHYTGKLLDGPEFDSSREREPFTFTLGVGQVIKGYDQGLLDMCVGEKRRLTIPPHLGYGEKGAGDKIPPNATLVFDVELIDVTEGEKQKNVFKEIDLDKDKLLSADEVKRYLWRMAGQLEEMADMMATKDGRNSLFEAVMTKHDANTDGFLSEEEFYLGNVPTAYIDDEDEIEVEFVKEEL